MRATTNVYYFKAVAKVYDFIPINKSSSSQIIRRFSISRFVILIVYLDMTYI